MVGGGDGCGGGGGGEGDGGAQKEHDLQWHHVHCQLAEAALHHRLQSA